MTLSIVFFVSLIFNVHLKNLFMVKFFISLCLISFTSCFSTKDFLKYDQIPGDFGKDNKPVFITPSSKERFNKIILDAFEKYYKGPYSFVSDDEPLRNYGYSFHAYIEYSNSFTTSGHIERDKDVQFRLTDLETKRVYNTFGFGYAKTKAKYYIQALEIVRQRNQ
jgi:hypothetical protein